MRQAILIVDDEFGLADLVGEVLQEQGYETAIAINGELALAQIREKRPDLVLLDVMMPILDGRETLRRLKANPAWASIPVVLMTALPEALPKDDPPLHAAVLIKPFSPAALLATLRRLLPKTDG